MHPDRQTVDAEGVICTGVLIVARLKGFKVGMLLYAGKINLSTFQLYNIQTEVK